MEIKQLQIFLAAAESLSFTEAAQRCYIVQSAVSQQIASLEKELGAALFIREKRGLHLTPEGEVFLKEARLILAQATHARFAVKDISQGYRESLRIGRQGDLLRELLPFVLREVMKQNPGLRFQFTRGLARELLDDLECCRIDCMLTVLFPEHRLYQWLDYQIIRREPVRFIIAADHPLAHQGRIHVSQLNTLPMILLSGSDTNAHLAALAESGYRESVYTYVDSQNSVEQMVALGCCVAPTAASAFRPHPLLTCLDVEDPPMADIAVCWNKNRVPPSLDRLLQAFRDMPQE